MADELIVVDLGKSSRRKIKKLRKGKGPLVGDVTSALDELRAAGTLPEGAVPVVFVLREKREGVLRLLR
jgi:hypothetical protein